jgi:hypothetical protein
VTHCHFIFVRYQSRETTTSAPRAELRRGEKIIRLKTLWAVAAVVGAAALLAAPTVTTGATSPQQQVDPSACAPSNTFTTTIDNPYFPLPVGQRWVYQGKEQGETIGLRITVLNRTERFTFGSSTVTTRVVEELEWVDADGDGRVDRDEELIEVSRNYFAQVQSGPYAGTVCYFGEEVDIYENGEIVSHEGAWRADAPGNAPGIYMPASPEEGMTFQQENAPGVAEDTATIVKVGRTVTVPAGTFQNAIVVRDFNPLDGSRGTKVYAPGVGLVVDGPLELIRF